MRVQKIVYGHLDGDPAIIVTFDNKAKIVEKDVFDRMFPDAGTPEWRDPPPDLLPGGRRAELLEEMKALYAGVRSRLGPEWASLFRERAH